MFTVGEFSQLAQVSKRLLRFYDEIGLLQPVRIDERTGYRFYSAEQMPKLNRILALKELGLSLDQIRRILRDNITTEEIQGMLLLRKAEIEQHLEEEMKRLRSIESRLQSIRSAEAHAPLNVVIKSIPAQAALSVRSIVESFEVGMTIMSAVRRAVPLKAASELCFVICHSDGITDRDMDLEIGCLTETPGHRTISLYNDMQLTYRELPAEPTMATIVVKGALETIHTGYAQIGLWAEANEYRLAGAARELSLQIPKQADGSDLITEIQFPVSAI